MQRYVRSGYTGSAVVCVVCVDLQSMVEWLRLCVYACARV
jgi:hypothetical protein